MAGFAGSPRVSIYRAKKGGRLRIQPYGKDATGSQYEWGPWIDLEPDATPASIARAVLELLPFAMKRGRAGEQVLLAPDGVRALARDFDLISVAREDLNLRVASFMGYRGRHVSAGGSTLIRPASGRTEEEQLAKALVRAISALDR